MCTYTVTLVRFLIPSRTHPPHLSIRTNYSRLVSSTIQLLDFYHHSRFRVLPFATSLSYVDLLSYFPHMPPCMISWIDCLYTTTTTTTTTHYRHALPPQRLFNYNHHNDNHHNDNYTHYRQRTTTTTIV